MSFNLRSIVVSKDDAPILLLPLFANRFDLPTFAEGWIKRALEAAGRLVPPIVRPRILRVGLLVGTWSEIGIDPQIDAGTLEAAWTMALGALLPGEVFKRFNRVQCLPCGQTADCL